MVKILIYIIYQISSKADKCVDSCLYTYKQMINIICDLSTFDGSIPKIQDNDFEINGIVTPLWSGKSILSYILPDNINLEMKNSVMIIITR